MFSERRLVGPCQEMTTGEMVGVKLQSLRKHGWEVKLTAGLI